MSFSEHFQIQIFAAFHIFFPPLGFATGCSRRFRQGSNDHASPANSQPGRWVLCHQHFSTNNSSIFPLLNRKYLFGWCGDSRFFFLHLFYLFIFDTPAGRSVIVSSWSELCYFELLFARNATIFRQILHYQAPHCISSLLLFFYALQETRLFLRRSPLRVRAQQLAGSQQLFSNPPPPYQAPHFRSPFYGCISKYAKSFEGRQTSPERIVCFYGSHSDTGK